MAIAGVGNDSICRVAWSPDGRLLAAGFNHLAMIRVWDVYSGCIRSELTGHEGPVFSIQWSPDGKSIASASGDATVRIWDPGTGKTRQTLAHCSADESPFSHAVYDLAWSIDSKKIVSASHDYHVRTWDITSGQLLAEQPIHSGPALCIAWSYDGHMVASGAGIFSKEILLHDFQQLKPTCRLLYHTSSVLSLAWSRDSQWLASASADRTVRIWNRQEGRQEAILEGHTDDVTSVSFSHDGSILASKSTDGTVRLWQTDSWIEVARIPERSSGETVFTGVSFHPKELMLATTGGRGTRVRLWVIDKELLLPRSKVIRGSGQHVTTKAVLAKNTGADKSSFYDVLLSYNHKDHCWATAIAEALRQRSLTPWIDSEQIPPGQPFQDALQQAIRTVKSAAILIGPAGLGSWHMVELRTLVSESQERGIPIIPVLLPGVTEIPKELAFLKEFNSVVFNTTVEETEVLDRLQWGITGERRK